MVSQSMTQVGKWSRRIGGGALVLALVGLSAPATTSARFAQDETPIEVPGEGEVIRVYGQAPSPTPTPQPTISPFDTGAHTGAGAPNYDPSGGGSESGGGLFDGYGYVPCERCISGHPEPVTIEQVMSWCILGEDQAYYQSLCNSALSAYNCVYGWGGTMSEVEEVELDANGDVVDIRFLNRCDIENPYGGWIQLWYDPEGGAEPIEICSGPTGQPGDCWEP